MWPPQDGRPPHARARGLRGQGRRTALVLDFCARKNGFAADIYPAPFFWIT